MTRDSLAAGDKASVVLGILKTVERQHLVTQRTLAAELGIALGLANAYLRRCVKKGLIKVKHVPPRRFAYYLTPSGFAEKSRLTVDYLSHSLDLFRRARQDCEKSFEEATKRGYLRVGLVGAGELAEIAAICALDSSVSVVAVIDQKLARPAFAGVPVISNVAEGLRGVDAAIITDMNSPQVAYRAAVAEIGLDRVLVPALLVAALPANDDQQGGRRAS